MSSMDPSGTRCPSCGFDDYDGDGKHAGDCKRLAMLRAESPEGKLKAAEERIATLEQALRTVAETEDARDGVLHAIEVVDKLKIGPKYGIWCYGTRTERKECWLTLSGGIHTFDTRDAAYATAKNAPSTAVDGWRWSYEVRRLDGKGYA